MFTNATVGLVDCVCTIKPG